MSVGIEDVLRNLFRDEIRHAVREIQSLREIEFRPSSGAAPGGLMLVQDVADACHVQPPTVLRWIHSKRLVARKPGHHYLVERADFERFLADERAPRPMLDGASHLALLMGRAGR